MSISVALDELRAAIADTGRAPYLITVSDDNRPHTVAVRPQWDGDDLRFAVGTHTLANAEARPHVTALWPPAEHDGYSLIVDADVVATSRSNGDAVDNRVTLRPTRATLHRPAPGLAEDAYGADCVRLPLT
ncbi:MAG: hypothetical protein ACHQIG_00275 [Acidimicrobiia bacterium]